MNRSSKKLARAISEGKVVVKNRTSGEAVVWLTLESGETKQVFVAPRAEVELSPKHTPAPLLRRSRNLQGLLYQGILILM